MNYTNWVEAIPIANEKTQTITEALYSKIICKYGTPKAVICDEGPAFTSDLMKAYFHSMNIKTILYFTQWIMDLTKLKGILEHWMIFYVKSCQVLEYHGHYLYYHHVGLWILRYLMLLDLLHIRWFIIKPHLIYLILILIQRKQIENWYKELFGIDETKKRNYG